MPNRFSQNDNPRIANVCSSLVADLQRHEFVCCVPEADITALRLLQQRRLDVQTCLIYLRMTEPRWKTVLADQAS